MIDDDVVECAECSELYPYTVCHGVCPHCESRQIVPDHG